MYRNLIVFFIFFLFVSPVCAGISGLNIFWPGDTNSIGTTDVSDIAAGKDGSVFFATSNGLSLFNNGKWTIIHSKASGNIGYLDGIPKRNDIKCVEFDSFGNLWLGYNDGLQIYNGYSSPVNIIKEYPKGTLQEYQINDLQVLGEQMWIATGSSGVYCYQNGEWKWFKPYGMSGPDATRIVSMAVDYAEGNLYLASEKKPFNSQGNFILINDDVKGAHFKKISDYLIVNDMENVRTNRLGGVYFFNKTDIVSYSLKGGSSHILNIREVLKSDDTEISDIASLSDGKILIGTNSGLFSYKNGDIITSFSGKEIFDSQISKVFVDSDERWWFTNKKIAGYYQENKFSPVISIELP